MNEENLQDLFEKHRIQPLPRLSPGFQTRVWREIQARRVPERTNWISWLLEPLLRPQFALAALVLALLLGGGVGLTSSASHAERTRIAFGLDLFSAKSPSLPMTLIEDIQ